MHIVQLLLQILDLLSERLLLVELLMALLLGCLGLHPYPRKLDVLIDHGFQGVEPCPLAVLGQQGISVFVACRHPRAQTCTDVAEGFPRRDKAPKYLAPLELAGERQQRFLHRGQPLFRLLRVQILDFGTAGHRQLDRLIGVNIDLVQIDPLPQMDHKIALVVDLPDRTGNTDGIKAVAVQLPTAIFLFRYDDCDPLILCRHPARHRLIYICLEIDVGMRDGNHVVDRHNCHGYPSCSGTQKVRVPS